MVTCDLVKNNAKIPMPRPRRIISQLFEKLHLLEKWLILNETRFEQQSTCEKLLELVEFYTRTTQEGPLACHHNLFIWSVQAAHHSQPCVNCLTSRNQHWNHSNNNNMVQVILVQQRQYQLHPNHACCPRNLQKLYGHLASRVLMC